MNFFGGQFFGGGFFGANPTPTPQTIIVGGGHEQTWRDRIRLRLEERSAARLLAQKQRKLRSVERVLKKIEQASAELPPGILAQPARYIALSEQRDTLTREIDLFKLDLQGIATAIRSFDEEQDDETIFLLI